MDSRRPTQPSIDDPMFEGSEIDGRYVVGPRIGQGGMGAVFRARQTKLDRDVVIKVLRADVAGEGQWAARFAREAKAASAVQHQNIVEIIDFGELDDGRPYLVMESLQGEDLAQLLTRERRLSWSRTRGVLLQVIAALGAAHERGVLHRDIKPSNCFLVSDRGGPSGEFVKLLDFGIATFLEPARISRRLTDHSMVIGTTTYLAPELAGGETATVASDVYATGVLAYKMLTGRVPFFSKNPFEVLERVRTEPIPTLRSREPTVPVHVEALVLRALARDPSERFASMADFEVAIRMLDAAGNPAASGRTGTVFPEEVAPAMSDVPPSRRPPVGDAPKKTLVAAHAPAPPRPRSRPRRRRAMVAILAVVTATLGIAAAAYLWNRRPQPTEDRAPPVEAPATVAQDQSPPDAGIVPSAAKVDFAEPVADPDPDPGEALPLERLDVGSPIAEPPPQPKKKRPRGGGGGPDLKNPFSQDGRLRPSPAPVDTDARAETRVKQQVARACKKAGSGTVPVKFSVGSSGKISLVRLRRRDKDTPLGDCVSQQLRKARFPAGALRAVGFEITVR